MGDPAYYAASAAEYVPAPGESDDCRTWAFAEAEKGESDGAAAGDGRRFGGPTIGRWRFVAFAAAWSGEAGGRMDQGPIAASYAYEGTGRRTPSTLVVSMAPGALRVAVPSEGEPGSS